MKIEKAIEELEKELKEPSTFNYPNTLSATKLGIEALKRIQQCRFPPYGRMEDTLPGETKD